MSEKIKLSSRNKFELLSVLKPEEIIKVEAKGEKRKNSLPILYVPGWGETSKTTEPLLNILAQDNDVISFDLPRQKRVTKKFAKKKFEGAFSNLELQEAFATIQVIENFNYEKVDAIGSSYGGMVLVLGAYLAPEKFRTITLVEPVGIMGEDDLISLAKRFATSHAEQNKARPIEQQKQVLLGREDFKTFWQKNIIQALQEIKKMSKADIIDMVAGLHELGIGISIISHVNDKVFPNDRVQTEVSKRLVDKESNSKKYYFDGFYNIRSVRKNKTGEQVEYDGGHADIRFDKNFQNRLRDILHSSIDSINKKSTI